MRLIREKNAIRRERGIKRLMLTAKRIPVQLESYTESVIRIELGLERAVETQSNFFLPYDVNEAFKPFSIFVARSLNEDSIT